jgi:hypothetical protein
MARINQYHVAYLEELYDVNIDTFYPDANAKNWANLNLKDGESKEWEYNGTVIFKVTKRSSRRVPLLTEAGPGKEDMSKLTWRSRIKLWLGGQPIDIQKFKETQASLHERYKAERYE